MKRICSMTAVLAVLSAGVPAFSQTLDWGSPVATDIVDSHGNPIDSLFVIEMGAFVDGFTPTESNVQDWFTNWRVFDTATYNSGLMYFTSVASMNDDGTSTGAPPTNSTFDFQGLDAFLWIRKGNDPIEGNEWLLTRSQSSDPAKNWVFPSAVPGCCDNQGNLQWSVSDLNGDDVPKWGNQGGVSGPGVFTSTGSYTLQTYTFVPEPGTPMILMAAGGLLAARRRRVRA